MSWLAENTLKWYHRFVINIIKCGPIPRHVAFIMDGNRRYASKNKVKNVTGHTRGFDKLAETLMWCGEIGIREVTVYAFSIENFKRNTEEVETLMQLAREKFQRLLDEKDKLHAQGVCIRVIGNLEMIPEDLRKAIAEAVLFTKDNDSAFLNVAFAYTSRDEITNSIQTIIDGVQNNKIISEDISADLITDCMYGNKSPSPEIIIRTSGEVRFSDFMLWQIWNTNVIFTDVLWPDFNVWHLLWAVFHYQRSYKDMVEVADCLQYDKGNRCDRIVSFLEQFEEERINRLKQYAV